MKAASLSELKLELITLPPKTVLELCLRLVKFKKENKELLSFLLFKAHNEEGYVQDIKKEIDDGFWNLSRGSMYIIKKGLRKILRSITKYSKHTGSKQAEVEMLLHFCQKVKESGIKIYKSAALTNLYAQQLKKIHEAFESLHEDLLYDYKKQLSALT